MIIMYYYLSYFFAFSIIGYIYENVIHLILQGNLTNNPFIGPYMPVYGFGIVIMLLIENFSKNKKIYFTGGDGKFLSRFFENAIYDDLFGSF